MGIIEKIKKKLYKKPTIERVAIFSHEDDTFSMRGKHSHLYPCKCKKIHRYEDDGCDGR